MDNENVEINLKNILLAGVGAVAESLDKSKEVFGELVEKGSVAVEKSKVLNEELKHKIEDKIKENVEIKVVKEDLNTSEDIMNAIDNLSDEDLQAIKDKIAERESEKGKADGKADGEGSEQDKKD